MALALSFVSIVHNLFSLLLGIFGLGLLITIHELGHLLFAKMFHVLVPSFSIGFGPVILSKKIGETTYSLSAIPLGGYVEIAGNEEVGQGEQLEAHRTDERSIVAKSYWKQVFIMAGGILANVIFAYGIFTLTCMQGLPQHIGAPQTTTIAFIEKESPAARAALKEGDTILAVNGVETGGQYCQICSMFEGKAETDMLLTVKRGDSSFKLPVHLGTSPYAAKRGYLGVQYAQPPLAPQSFSSALMYAGQITGFIVRGTLKAFTDMFTKRSFATVGGPISILAATTKSAKQDWISYFIVIAIISISLAVLNILPLPIFDGGQILIFTIEAIMRRRLSDRARLVLAYTSWILVLALFLVLSIKDIVQLASSFIS